MCPNGHLVMSRRVPRCRENSINFRKFRPPLVFVRPGELRAAEWTEFDLDSAEWRIRRRR